MYKNLTEYKIHLEIHEKLVSGNNSWRKSLTDVKFLWGIYMEYLLSPLIFVIIICHLIRRLGD